MRSRGPLEHRVKLLEDALAVTQRENREQLARQGRWRAPREIRKARTCYPGDGIYPAEDSGTNVYPIIFEDGEFAETIGVQTVDYDDRQDAQRHVMIDESGEYLPVNTHVLVHRQNNRWWRVGSAGSGETLSTIPFRNDSGETAPAYAVMQVIDVETDSRTATVDTGTDVWTLASAVTWATGQKLRYTTTGSAPTTSPADLINDGWAVWARVLSTTTIKIYSSEADAIADTSAIDFTTTGSGTHKFADLEASEFLLIQKPDTVVATADNPPLTRLYVVNEGTAVEDGEMGRCRQFSCSYGFPVRARIAVGEYLGEEPPTIGDILGPMDDSWNLGPKRFGFYVVGNYDETAETITVIQERERLSSGDYSQFFTYHDDSNDDDYTFDPFEVGLIQYGFSQGLNIQHPSYPAANWGNIFGIVSADGLPYYSYGQSSLCYDRPAWAKYEAYQGTPAIGDIYGPVKGSAKLHRGLPGFQCLSYDTENEIMLVIADHRCTIFEAKAYDNWTENGSYPQSPYVMAHPYDSANDEVYDGGTPGWPDFNILISLPRNGSGRDPNIRTGNRLQYGIVASSGPGTTLDRYRYLCVSPYLDDKIGTVKMYTGNIANVPQGWREKTAMRDTFPVGVLASTGIATTVGAGGGSKTHTHTTSGSSGAFGGTTKVLDAANHLPPYYGVYFIERFE
jgi:hypothetical protein